MKLYNFLFVTAGILTLLAAGTDLPGWAKWICVVLTGACLVVASEKEHAAKDRAKAWHPATRRSER